MKIVKWKVIDIYYNIDEDKEVNKEIKRLERNGYTAEHLDDLHGDYEYCTQMIKWFNGKLK